MKKAILAIAALTGTALTTNAAMLKVSDQTFANFGLKLQIYGQVLDDAANGGKDNAVDFTIQNARIYFSGQLNSIVQFGANLDFPVTGAKTSHEGTSNAKVRDAFINFHFMNELNVMAGYYRIPFNRETLTDRYDRIFMPQDGWVGGGYKDELLTIHVNNKTTLHLTASNVLGGPALGNALTSAGLTDESDFARDAGVTVWGTVFKGMVRYYVGVFDGFGDHNVGEVLAGSSKDNLAYAVRVEFTPTMLGFQGDKGFLRKETYLGKKNDLTLGIGYYYSKLDLGNKKSYDFKSWTIDVNYEQKFGVFVPKFEAGYVQTDADNFINLDKVKAGYVTLGVLYDQKILLGKIGAYVKYEGVKVEPQYGNSIKPKVWSVAIPYYLADQNAKIVLQYNHYDYDKKGLDPRADNDDKNSDWTLAFQVQF